MKLTEKEKTLLKQVVDHFDKEDRATRNRQIRIARRLKFLWDNLQYTYYSEVAHDWRIPDDSQSDDQSYYDKPVNVFRAYLESIIAALSISIPSVTCYPEDADNPLDVTTAKAGDKIAQLIFRHNDAPLLWLHALYIYCTEGMLACYHYPKEDKNFGTYENKIYEDVEENKTEQVCPSCGATMGENESEFVPTGEMDSCPSCGQMVMPNSIQSTETNSVLKEIQHLSKTRVLLDVYGLLYVKIPVYARRQCDCPYLIWSYETHYSNVLEEYPELWDKMPHGGSGYETYEQWGRLSTQYKGEYPTNTVTVRNAWLRPSAFNILKEDEAAYLKKKFSDGVKVVLVNDGVADGEPENLDDYWTLSYNPLSDYIHFDPLGLLLTSIQEITNDLLSLVVQTVEHGIPQTFANPKALDFKAYRDSEVIPGGIYPAQSPAGRPLGENFYEVKTATLSGEVLPFANKVQEMGQLVSGALPSLFGGQVSGSRTASEYSMSRSQAQQRLSIPWKMLVAWWKNIFTKAIPMFINEMKDDEQDVDKNSVGNFINTFIRKSEATGGKLGKIELEASEALPITWSQQKDAIMELFSLNNDEVLKTLGSPENMPYLRKALGLTDYTIPGEDDRTKQYEEIVQLVNSDPIQMPGMGMDGMGQPLPEQEIPSVEVDPDVDNHAIEFEICRNWLVSEAGRLAKIDNLSGYKNVLLHMKMHKEAMIAQSAAMQPPPTNGNAAPNNGGEDGGPTE
jgi:predicted RNA-binding Zn-ribbon protein involved in translation (DUF1610 family)